MTKRIPGPSHSSVRDSSTSLQQVVRTPFYFESQGQSCFAWLHRDEHASNLDHGIILCSPLGHEQVHAHRSLRHLADKLAAARFCVVRFDFHGTGDSSGSDEDADRVTTWLANLSDVQHWLRQQLGCRRISVIGLRLGAALAAQAAMDQPVDSLLLWAPVVKGGSYVREMKALSLTNAVSAPASAASPGEIEAAGFVLTEQTLRDVKDLDLLQIRPLCRRALILSREDNRHDTHLLEHFKGHGVETRQVVVPGYADMMAEPHYNQVPWTAIHTMVDWLDAGSPDRYRPDEECYGIESPLSVQSSPCTVLSPQPLRECVLPISSQPHLFGILSEPLKAPPEDLPIIVFLNAGSCYRVGPNRLYVYLARQLTGQGFRCLRMDLCGLGDSISTNFRHENNPYPATAFRDIDLTLRYLTRHLGMDRVVLMGLCSGAYAAFQSTVQLNCPALVESVLINPLTFYWREGMSLESSPALQLRSFQDCMASARQPEKWLKFLSGRSKLGINGALRMLVQRWRLKDVSQRNRVFEGESTNADGLPTHPVHEDLMGDLQRVAEASRHLACFFARSDPGYALLTLHAKRKTNELRRDGRMSVYFLDDADHTFTRRAARRALGQVLTQHLVRRYRVKESPWT